MQTLVVFRGLMGLGLGGAPGAFALFLELVPSARRGVLMVTLQGFWTVGSRLEVAERPMCKPSWSCSRRFHFQQVPVS